LKKLSFILMFLLVISAATPLLNASTIYVSPSTYFTFPTTNTMFNFISEQELLGAHLTSSANASYPEYWFLTKTNGETYGFQSETANFTITNFVTSDTLTFSTNTLGSVKVYTGSLGEPTSVSGASMTYDSTLNVATFTFILASTVSVSWAAPTPTPTPTPTATPTPTPTATPPPTVTLTINSPTNTTYTDEHVLLSVTATGGTIDTIIFNLDGPVGWKYTDSPIYTNPRYLTDFVNGSYTLHVYANNTAGLSDYKTVSFTMSIPAPTPTPTPTPTVPPETPPPTTAPATPRPPSYFENTMDPATLYFRSDTYTTLEHIGYGLDVDYTNTVASVTDTLAAGNVTYGYRVWLVGGTGYTVELTDGVSAMTTISTNTTGYVESTYTMPTASVTLGYQALKVTIYLSQDGEEWTSRANFLSNVLITNNVVGSRWTFRLYVDCTLTGSETVSTIMFGNANYRSAISNVIFTQPSIYDVMFFKLLQGDFLGFVAYNYISTLGGAFYLLVLVAVLGAYYVWHGKASIVLFMLVMFGSAGGLVFLFLPTPANLLVWVLMAVVLVVLLFRVIR
jgi:hypothetical protein